MTWRPGPCVYPARLFDGRHVRRRQLSAIDLLAVMEAAAQRQRRSEDGKRYESAHDLILLLSLTLDLGTRDCVHLTALRLEKR